MNSVPAASALHLRAGGHGTVQYSIIKLITVQSKYNPILNTIKCSIVYHSAGGRRHRESYLIAQHPRNPIVS